MCNHLHTIPSCDGQTNRRTDGWTDILPRHSPRYASRGKKPMLLVCVQHYCKSNLMISLKLCVIFSPCELKITNPEVSWSYVKRMTGPTNRKNWLTFGGDPVRDTDSASLFHFLHSCRIGDFGRFISISQTVTGQFSQPLAKWLKSTR